MGFCLVVVKAEPQDRCIVLLGASPPFLRGINSPSRATCTSRRSQNRMDGEGGELPEAALYDVGVFYLLRLEPQHDPNRFKVGFASNLSERLRQHKCSAPFTEVIKTWPCRRLWEKTAIECVTANCERLHTEIFRAQSISEVEQRCDQFFALMPSLSSNAQSDTEALET